MRIGRESRRGNSSRVKRGGAAGALAAVLAVAAVVLVLAWALGHDPATGAAGPTAHDAPAATGPTEKPFAAEPAPRAPEGIARAPAAGALTDPARFQGRGRIRGRLVTEGRPIPQSWSLVLEPHPTLVGANHAESRTVAFEQGEQTFDVPDLSLGGYRVSARSAGLNSTIESVLLVQGSSNVHVTLRLTAAGLVDGFVLDHRGQPAEGLLVTIEDRRTRARSSATVDASGQFVLHDVTDGEYRILFGAPTRPLVPPGDFSFRAPTLRWPEVHLPATGDLRVAVRDANGAGIAEAFVSGPGAPQGAASGTAGGDGVLLLKWLWPARYRLTAKSPDGRSGVADVDVPEGAVTDVTIRVH
jgi:hypothetical protein